MPRSASYDDLLMDMLKDEERAFAYLNAALDESDQKVFLIALRNITQAQGGIGKVAARSGLNRESLYRALSEKGNPSVQTLTAVLGALGVRLGVAQIDDGPRCPCAACLIPDDGQSSSAFVLGEYVSSTRHAVGSGLIAWISQ